jgi:hypothetical protein
VRELLPAPRRQHHVERLLEEGAGLVDRHPEHAVLWELVAAPDADVDAAAGRVVEEGDALGEAEWVGEGEVDDGRADPHAARAGGEVPGEEERVARQAVGREVLLRDPDVGEAEVLAQHGSFELFGNDALGLLPGGTLEDVVGSEAHARKLAQGRSFDQAHPPDELARDRLRG